MKRFCGDFQLRELP